MVLLGVMRATAYSTASRATVRMVPSVGVMTDEYACSTPRRSALPKVTASAESTSSRPFAVPAKNWERMTPELPRAPKSIPCEKVFITVARLSVSVFSNARIPLSMVRRILSPVSPSGTGNTLSLLTSSALERSVFAPPIAIFFISQPPMSLMLTGEGFFSFFVMLLSSCFIFSGRAKPQKAYFSLPIKNSASVPGPACAPMTGPTLATI